MVISLQSIHRRQYFIIPTNQDLAIKGLQTEGSYNMTGEAWVFTTYKKWNIFCKYRKIYILSTYSSFENSHWNSIKISNNIKNQYEFMIHNIQL